MLTRTPPIVLVEDASDGFLSRHAIESLFQNPLIVYTSAAEALEGFRRGTRVFDPVIAIIDVGSGDGHTGLDVLKWIRLQSGPLGSTPALMLTGSDRAAGKDRRNGPGAMVYLQKPLTDEKLVEAAQALGCAVVTNMESGELGSRILQRRRDALLH